MKIVIDIPEDVKKAFDEATKDDLYGCYYDANSVIGNAIKNGTPLPKGHGALVDAKEYIKDVCSWFDSDECCDYDCKNCEFVPRIAELFDHIVVEADKEGADNEDSV